jgi:hypothetical protein
MGPSRRHRSTVLAIHCSRAINADQRPIATLWYALSDPLQPMICHFMVYGLLLVVRARPSPQSSPRGLMMGLIHRVRKKWAITVLIVITVPLITWCLVPHNHVKSTQGVVTRSQFTSPSARHLAILNGIFWVLSELPVSLRENRQEVRIRLPQQCDSFFLGAGPFQPIASGTPKSPPSIESTPPAARRFRPPVSSEASAGPALEPPLEAARAPGGLNQTLEDRR